MITVEQLQDELPPDVFEELVAELERGADLFLIQRSFKSSTTRGFIHLSMNWAHTRKGHQYWKNVYVLLSGT